MLFLIVLVLFSVILLALFLWNKLITPTAFEVRGSHVFVRALFSHLTKLFVIMFETNCQIELSQH